MKIANIFSRSVLALLLVVTSTALFSAPKVVVLGIVTDGPSPLLEQIIGSIDDEIQALVGDEFDVRLLPGKRIDGGWQLNQISPAFSKLYADPEVDIVLALGFGAATIAVNQTNFPKPTLAMVILDEQLSGAPRKGVGSGVDNLTYVSIESELEEAVKTLQSLTDISAVAVLFDALIAEAFMKNRRSEVASIGKRLNLQVIPVLNRGQSDYLDQLPADVDAVMIGAVPRVSKIGQQHLLQQLKQRKLPSFSLMGAELVEAGALVTDLPVQNWQRRIRRLALQVQGVLLGENPAEMEVALDGARQLVINMQTAGEIGISLPFDVLLEAKTLFDDSSSATASRQWTLNQVAHTAMAENLSARAARLELAAGGSEVEQARSLLYPQLSMDINQTSNNDDNTSVVAGAVAERSGSASLNMSQVIYNEGIRANLDIQESLQDARSADLQQILLDTVQEAVLAFLNALNAKTQSNVSRDTLNVNRSNLEQARDRVQVGSSSNADIYRWQTEVANARSDLLDADADLDIAREALNQLLNRPLGESFHLIPASLDDPTLIISDPRLLDLIENDAQFQQLGKMLLKTGLAASPEIAALSARIAAQTRSLKSQRSTRWSPEVTFTGSLSTTYDDSRSDPLSEQGNDNWGVGVNLSLPLYQGGAISERVSEEELTLGQLQLELENVHRSIEQNIRSQLHSAKASKLAINLSRDSASAAKKNLNLISDSYRQGAGTIIDLLDAQNASTSADLRAAQSVYLFLIDLMNLQRSVGSFDFFLDEHQRQTRINSITSNLNVEQK